MILVLIFAASTDYKDKEVCVNFQNELCYLTLKLEGRL